jgi:hypothetical protein
MRNPEAAKFIANVSDASILTSALPLLRKELSSKGADFLAEVQDSLNRNPGTRVSKRKVKDLARISVTIFYHESYDKTIKQRIASKRRNFHREM